MKQALAISAALLAVSGAVAGSFALPPQGASPHADTEMSTNIAFGTSGDGRLRKAFDLSLSLAGTTSNCLQVAFGRDADGDGVLDPSETDTVYGWRAGRYFVEDARGWRPKMKMAILSLARWMATFCLVKLLNCCSLNDALNG